MAISDKIATEQHRRYHGGSRQHEVARDQDMCRYTARVTESIPRREAIITETFRGADVVVASPVPTP